MNDIDALMRAAPVIPVLVIHQIAHARPIAEALVAGGLPVLEVTLRTPVALEAIAEMTRVEGAIVGAGTVLNQKALDAALTRGARFVVSPGLTDPLAKAALASGTPFLPGVANASDIMRGLDLGLDHFKFFPAEAAGGVPALKSLTGPFPHARFCPTGGVNLDNLLAWMAIPQVLCVGGSWLVDAAAPDPARIRAAAAGAVALFQRGVDAG
jgi:2-dehydro-3-deoxyphosphogluconate aldolase/(4S)-4-hydroxy-2-oxoglutarate aldolase